VFLAGCGGGLVATVAACPVEVIKIQMQSQIGNCTEKTGLQAASAIVFNSTNLEPNSKISFQATFGIEKAERDGSRREAQGI